MMKAAELRQKSEGELKSELTALLKAQFSLRMQHATGQLAKKQRDQPRAQRHCAHPYHHG